MKCKIVSGLCTLTPITDKFRSVITTSYYLVGKTQADTGHTAAPWLSPVTPHDMILGALTAL